MSEFFELQTSFFRKQAELAVEQAKSMQEATQKVAENVTKPGKDAAEKAMSPFQEGLIFAGAWFAATAHQENRVTRHPVFFTIIGKLWLAKNTEVPVCDPQSDTDNVVCSVMCGCSSVG